MEIQIIKAALIVLGVLYVIQLMTLVLAFSELKKLKENYKSIMESYLKLRSRAAINEMQNAALNATAASMITAITAEMGKRICKLFKIMKNAGIVTEDEENDFLGQPSGSSQVVQPNVATEAKESSKDTSYGEVKAACLKGMELEKKNQQ